VIFFIHKGFQAFTHKKLESLYKGKFQAGSYNRLLRRLYIPRGTYIFTDRERMDPWELRVYARLYGHLQKAGPGYRVLNNPAFMTNRLELLRLLHREGINDFNVYPVSEQLTPARFPVFIRRIYDHKKPLTGLLNSQEELENALKKLKDQNEPAEGTIIVEYCAEPVQDDLFRKISVFRVGEQVFFYQTVHERNWLIKYGTMNSATDELYREEQKMILENTYADTLHRVFDLAGIEYGRADCGVVDGKIQVYEINTNPHIIPPFPHPNPIRQKSMQLGWEKYMKALAEIDTTEPHAPLARRFRHADVNNFFQRLYYGSLVKRQ